MQQNSAKVAVAVNVRLKYSSTSIELKKPTKLISLTVVVGQFVYDILLFFLSFCLSPCLPSSFTSFFFYFFLLLLLFRNDRTEYAEIFYSTHQLI